MGERFAVTARDRSVTLAALCLAGESTRWENTERGGPETGAAFTHHEMDGFGETRRVSVHVA